jgi:hypothetical protein
MNFTGAGYRGDEGRFGSAAEAAHFVESEFEGCGHVLTGHVAGGENELADSMNFQGALSRRL